MTMHDLVNHATCLAKRNANINHCLLLVTIACNMLLRIYIKYAHKFFIVSGVTILVFHEKIFIVELFRVNLFLIARTVHNSKYDDVTIGFPVEVGHGFFFPPSCSTARNVMYSFGASERAARETHRVFVEAAARC